MARSLRDPRSSGLQTAGVVLLVPAYNPSARLPELLQQARSAGGFSDTIVVDDGSSAESHEVFRQIAAMENTTLLRHAVNLGKGAALKTGINAALVRHGPRVAIVTMDADGQHDPSDARAVRSELERNPAGLVLGVRRLSRHDTPFRSRLGNLATRGLVRLLIGLKLTDTQTGLRGIPGPLAERLLRIESQRYEFELDMLILCRHLGWPIREVPIATIYEDDNRRSHFNPLKDSLRIYWVLFRFLSASLASAVLDNLLFVSALASGLTASAAHGSARALSLGVNYALLHKFVFFSDQRHREILPKYLLVVVLWWTASLELIHYSVELTEGRVSIAQAKILVESILFPLNFLIQREWVFRRRY